MTIALIYTIAKSYYCSYSTLTTNIVYSLYKL